MAYIPARSIERGILEPQRSRPLLPCAGPFCLWAAGAPPSFRPLLSLYRADKSAASIKARQFQSARAAV